MKKVLATGLLAICAIACTQQQASAWINNRFGVGVNWDFQSGGNTWGWGAWRNGQPPGPESLNAGPFQPYGPVFPPNNGPSQQAPTSPNYGAPPPHHHAYFDAPMIDHSYYAQPAAPFAPSMQQYGPTFQSATYPRSVYYYYSR